MDQGTIDYVINLLRQGTIKWEGRKTCLRRARKKVLVGQTKEGKPKYKLHWQCAKCKTWFNSQDALEVDHIVEIGPFEGDWNKFVSKVFCGQDNLQALCIVCHKRKTSFFNSRLKYERKKDYVE